MLGFGERVFAIHLREKFGFGDFGFGEFCLWRNSTSGGSLVPANSSAQLVFGRECVFGNSSLQFVCAEELFGFGSEKLASGNLSSRFFFVSGSLGRMRLQNLSSSAGGKGTTAPAAAMNTVQRGGTTRDY